jgi:hypothetical protein
MNGNLNNFQLKKLKKISFIAIYSEFCIIEVFITLVEILKRLLFKYLFLCYDMHNESF